MSLWFAVLAVVMGFPVFIAFRSYIGLIALLEHVVQVMSVKITVGPWYEMHAKGV